jgi:hypothetical protein
VLAYRDARIARLDPAHWPALTGGLEIVNVHMASPAFGRKAWTRSRIGETSSESPRSDKPCSGK